MYKVTLKDGRIIELSTKQLKVMLENWDKPEVEEKFNMIKEWELVKQPELTGFEQFQLAGKKLRRSKDS